MFALKRAKWCEFEIFVWSLITLISRCTDKKSNFPEKWLSAILNALEYWVCWNVLENWPICVRADNHLEIRYFGNSRNPVVRHCRTHSRNWVKNELCNYMRVCVWLKHLRTMAVCKRPQVIQSLRWISLKLNKKRATNNLHALSVEHNAASLPVHSQKNE